MSLLYFTLPGEVSGHEQDPAGDVAAPSVWIVEDEPAAAELAADLCIACGARPELFRSALPFLRAFRDGGLPRAVVLDWRLERELSAALFLATRHRFPHLPVIYWTGSPGDALPAAVRDDPCTRIVDKAAGTAAFDLALTWALHATEEETMGINDAFRIPKDPHPGEPDEMTPGTAPIDDIERPHDGAGGLDDPAESLEKDLDEPGAADRTPRP